MKNIKIIILTIFLVFSINISNATEVYFVSMTKILNESTAGKKAQEFLKKKFVSQSKEFEKESKTLKKEESELIAKKKVLSPEEYKKSINKLREKNIAFQKKRQKSSNDFLKQKNEARGKMLVAINPILQKYMDENGIMMIMNEKNVILANSKVDLTNIIIDLLNKELKSIKLN